MKKSKKLILLSLLAAFFVLSSAISYAVSPKQQAKIVAEEELPELKEFIDGHYKNFHFNSLEDLKKAYLGKPIENYKIYNFNPNKSIKEQMEKSAFYVFPVMVDGKAVTDVTVALQDKQWKIVDIGGHLSTLIQNSKNINNLTDIKILRFYGETFVLGNKNNKMVGFLPYRDSKKLEIEKGKIIKVKKIKKVIEKKKKDIEKIKKKNKETGKKHYGTSSTTPTSKLEFKQKNIINRLIKYINHIL